MLATGAESGSQDIALLKLDGQLKGHGQQLFDDNAVWIVHRT